MGIDKVERWQAIADAVPGRSPGDCQVQCRIMAEDAAARRRKEAGAKAARAAREPQLTW